MSFSAGGEDPCPYHKRVLVKWEVRADYLFTASKKCYNIIRRVFHISVLPRRSVSTSLTGISKSSRRRFNRFIPSSVIE